jgi:hypothetical protein
LSLFSTAVCCPYYLYYIQVKCVLYGSELGIRTLVPLAGPSPFQGAPIGLSGNSLYRYGAQLSPWEDSLDCLV